MVSLSACGILFTAISFLILGMTFISPANANTFGACVKNNSGNIKMADSAADCGKREYFISWSDQGPIGLTGATGSAGIDGQDGATGSQGPIGLIGPTGTGGSNGVDGQVGAPGSQGPIGLIGPAGIDGNNGADGQDGLSCWDLSGDGVQDPAEDINIDGSFNALDCVGAQGVAGVDGQDGAPGVAGTNGVDGQDGAPGSQGPIGLIGPAGIDGSNGVDGQDGAPGAAGNDGADGLQGPAGIDTSTPLSALTHESIAIQGPFIGASPNAISVATCPVLSLRTGGGCHTGALNNIVTIQWNTFNGPEGSSSWSCQALRSGPDRSGGLYAQAWVVCAAPISD